jgi:hypothetical protein
MNSLRNTESGTRTRPARRWSALAVVAVAAVALAACTPNSPSGGLPFRATVSATATPTDATHFTLTGTGTSPLLGRFDYGGTVEVTHVDPVTGAMTDTLTETLTTPTGSLTILCHQAADPTGPGTFSATDQWTVIGGTGAFAHATGSGTGHTDVNLNTGAVAKSMAGSLAFHL